MIEIQVANLVRNHVELDWHLDEPRGEPSEMRDTDSAIGVPWLAEPLSMRRGKEAVSHDLD